MDMLEIWIKTEVVRYMNEPKVLKLLQYNYYVTATGCIVSSQNESMYDVLRNWSPKMLKLDFHIITDESFFKKENN